MPILLIINILYMFNISYTIINKFVIFCLPTPVNSLSNSRFIFYSTFFTNKSSKPMRNDMVLTGIDHVSVNWIIYKLVEAGTASVPASFLALKIINCDTLYKRKARYVF